MTTPDAPPQTATWTPSLDSFGARLALVRQRMGWNVKEAATACGLPPESWRRWEAGAMEPRRIITIAMTISTRTGCDYLWLVHGPARGGAGQLTGGYPRDLADLVNPRIPAALAPRVIVPVRHGDGRRRPDSGRTIPRQTRSRGTAGQTSRPVSRTPVT